MDLRKVVVDGVKDASQLEGLSGLGPSLAAKAAESNVSLNAKY
ncbi:hypothetical protein [Acididesulfobacillus acetoxydans]|nr:hypothetical protein [Acididesulfobacillus acetoxydans]